MLLWIKQKQNKAKQTNKSTAIFHGLYSYRPQKWRQNVQNFAVELLADITSRSRFFEKLQLKWTPKLSMLLWKNKNKTKQTNKSTAIFHGLFSYRPQKWCQNVQNFAVQPLADISYESYLSLLSCVAHLCFGGQSRVVPGQPFLTKENNKAHEWRYVLWTVRVERHQ